jgi:NAD(P)-dependent dehydrogenase (short-subunit alcohol dehydrogenase family)
MSIVLITGCSSGLGHASALEFARNGHTVYATMRDPAKAGPLRAAAAAGRLDVRILALDVTQADTFDSVIGRIVAEAGRIDVLVNNAGVLRAGAFEDLEERAIREVMEVNFFGPFLLARAVLPQMRSQRSGLIIMISSLSGIAGLPGDVAYTASKFAVEGATEALRHEVDRWNIRVALVEAGLYATRIFDASLPAGHDLPPGYPTNSPYRPLVEHRLRELRARLPEAFDPALIGRLLVEVAASDGTQLRWPADATARKVLATMLAQNDAERDQFLRNVSGAEWWSRGETPPSPATR